MGLVDRVNSALAETRVLGGAPWQPWTDPWVRFDSGGPVHPTRSGGGGTDGALALQPVYSAVRFIAEGVGKTPVIQYRDLGTRKVRMPAGPLISKPSAYLRPFDWKVTGMTSVLLHGMAYGLITSRDGYGFATSVEWLPPDLVNVVDVSPFNPLKATFYYAGRPVAREDLFIIRGLSVPGRTEAISPLRAFQAYIEAGHAALEYGAGWYRSGGFPPGVFRNSQYEVTDEQSADIKGKLVRAIRRHEPLVHGSDWEFSPITVPPNEAQFIESMQMTATQVASIYGVQPRRAGGIHGDSMTYSNVEMDAISEVTDTLDPWLVRFEEAFFESLPQPQVAEFDRDARIRHDIRTRFDVYRVARDIGIMNVDEIRDLEDREPLPKPKDPDDYDGQDYTPLQIQVAAARGLATELGSGPEGAPDPTSVKTSGVAEPGAPPAPGQPGSNGAKPGPAVKPMPPGKPPAAVNGKAR
jgi:HK97 family phage portal protein